MSETSSRLAVFRADAGPAIGAGHVRRCQALADALADEGWTTAFASRTGTRDTVSELSMGPHAVFDLTGEETEETAALAARWPEGADLLVVDHYERSLDFERACRSWTGRILVIEDLPDRRHDADLLVDMAPGRGTADHRGRVSDDCRLLLGPDYALLRSRFAELRFARNGKEATGDPTRILVGLGATDPGNATGAAITAIEDCGFQGIVDVLLASTAPHLDAARTQCAETALDVRLHVDADDPAAIMADADLAIGAAGTSAWERCCIGLPAIMLVLAENQRANARGLAEFGACAVLDMGDQWQGELATVLRDLFADPARLSDMATNSALLCDGLGARRVAMALDPPSARDGVPVHLRPATDMDSERMFAWQQHPETRRFARSPTAPTRDEHEAWLAGKLSDPDCLLNLIVHGDMPAGVLRLDNRPRGDGLEISIFVDPGRYRLGLAGAALALARRLVPFATLHAMVLPGNAASRKLFEAAGYASAGNGWYLGRPNRDAPFSAPAAVGASTARGH